MRFAPLLALLCLLLPACPRADAQKSASTSQISSANKRVVLLLSGSSQSLWEADLLGALGAELSFDPFSTQSTEGHLDVMGPYDVKLGDTPVALTIGFLGLDRFTGMQAQSDLGVEAKAWIEKQQADAAWLDGDRAQFFVGRELVAATPVVFTGVVNDRQTYYGANATGVYKRPALPSLLKLIWDREPKAKNFALASDAAPVSRGSVQKFHELLSLSLRDQGKVIATEPAENWEQMRQRLKEAQQKADAVILTGIGEEQGGEAFNTPCPAGLLKGITVPVVAIGSSDAATCFPIVVRLRPSAHVQLALGMLGQVLDGTDPGGIPTVTPEEMQVTVNDRADGK